jgi:sugar lactone lactonase YvrE
VLKTLVSHDGAEPLIFCSNVVATPDGDLFFTISSMRYTVHEWRQDIVENVPTGRVYRRAADGTLTRLMDGLRFANGLVRARDGQSLSSRRPRDDVCFVCGSLVRVRERAR